MQFWSNKTKVELFRRKTATSVWWKNGTAFKKHNTIPTVKFGVGFIMIWGCFSSKGTSELQVIHGRMNGSMYREILEKNIQKSAASLGHGRNFVLPNDNDPKHIAKLTKEWFENNGISTLNWIQVSLLIWIQLRICGILWRLKFISGIHKISNN